MSRVLIVPHWISISVLPCMLNFFLPWNSTFRGEMTLFPTGRSLAGENWPQCICQTPQSKYRSLSLLTVIAMDWHISSKLKCCQAFAGFLRAFSTKHSGRERQLKSGARQGQTAAESYGLIRKAINLLAGTHCMCEQYLCCFPMYTCEYTLPFSLKYFCINISCTHLHLEASEIPKWDESKGSGLYTMEGNQHVNRVFFSFSPTSVWPSVSWISCKSQKMFTAV